MTNKQELYTTPAEPADKNAEYMTVQETAWVFRCSVKTIRRLCKEYGLGARVGSRIVLSRDERAAMFDARRTGGSSARVPAQRRRRSVKRASKPTAASASHAAA